MPRAWRTHSTNQTGATTASPRGPLRSTRRQARRRSEVAIELAAVIFVFSADFRPRRCGAAGRPDPRRRGTHQIVSTRLAHSHRSKDPRPAHGIVWPPTCPRCCRRRPLPFRWARSAVRLQREEGPGRASHIDLIGRHDRDPIRIDAESGQIDLHRAPPSRPERADNNDWHSWEDVDCGSKFGRGPD